MTEKAKGSGLLGESFLAELFKINSFIEPLFDLAPEDLAIGAMSVIEKAAHTWLLTQMPLLENLEEKVKIIFEKYKGKGAFMPEEPELAVLEAEALLSRKVEIVQQLLRVSVQERLKIPGHVRIKLAKGFIIAVRAEDLTKKPIVQTLTTTLCVKGEGPNIPPRSTYH